MSEAALQPKADPFAGDVRLDVSAQLLRLDQGLFSVELAADDVAMTEAGMMLPAARLDPLPVTGAGHCFISTLADTPLLMPGGHPAFLRVTGGSVNILLTIYKLAGGAAPRLHIKAMTAGSGQVPAVARPALGGMPALPSMKLKLLAHLANVGDVTVAGGAWAEAPGNAADPDSAIEGFSVQADDPIPADALEYQAILGQDWVSPWVGGGAFCGSRQMSLALLGLRVRLRGEAALQYRVLVWGRFMGTEVGPVEAGEACECDGALLQALRVVITEKAGGAYPPAGRAAAAKPRGTDAKSKQPARR